MMSPATTLPSAEDLGVLVDHLGYGNPSAPIWFVGMEERLVGDLGDNLRWRIREFRHPVDTIANTLRAPWVPSGTVPGTPTWRLMAKIARLLLDPLAADDWDDGKLARDYVCTRLGAADGSTFLAEILPLPAPRIDTWPYARSHWETRADYLRAVLENRQRLLRGFALQHRPKVIFCYGSSLWEHYQGAFPAEAFREHRLLRRDPRKQAVAVRVGAWEQAVVVLTPFFAPYRFPVDVVVQVPALLPPGLFGKQTVPSPVR